MGKPLLSVCLLTYNQAKYVKQAIDSILEQKVNFDWELIIADDCSTDGTREILQAYKKQSPKLITLILQKTNVGPEENWLTLMAYPKSRYVLYAEGDDYFTDPQKLQKQVDFLEANDDCAICFHPVKVTYEDGSRVDEIFPSPEQRFHKDQLELKDLLLNNFIQTNSAMYRWRFTRDNIKDTFPRGVAPGDWFLHVLHADIGKIGFINKAMSVYRKHAGGLWWDAHDNRDRFWEKYGLAWLKLYLAFLKMYGSIPEYRQIIEGSMINLLNSLIEVDSRQHGGLFHAALASSPEAADIYIDNLRQQVTALHHHADEQAKVIHHYTDLNLRLENENQRLAAVNHYFQKRPLTRLRQVVKRHLKPAKQRKE